MSIRTFCPNGHPVRVQEELAGKTGLCPRCRARLHVPLVEQDGDRPRPSGEFARQAPRPDWATGESAASAPGLPYPLKKKTRLCVGCGNIASQSFNVCPRCGTTLSTYRRLDVRKDADAIIVRFVDRQMRDDQTIREISEELCGIAERVQQQHLVLDFSGVVGLSSAMLGKLVMLQTKMKKQGGDLTLCKVGPEVRDTLATMKLDQVLHVENA
jgi:anti-anti-sigma factor